MTYNSSPSVILRCHCHSQRATALVGLLDLKQPAKVGDDFAIEEPPLPNGPGAHQFLGGVFHILFSFPFSSPSSPEFITIDFLCSRMIAMSAAGSIGSVSLDCSELMFSLFRAILVLNPPCKPTLPSWSFLEELSSRPGDVRVGSSQPW